jgi:hypothetical protein
MTSTSNHSSLLSPRPSFLFRTVRLALAAGLTLSIVSGVAAADMELPRPSPFAKVSQDIGLTTVTVDYSSPGVKGRKIWGGLVPYDKQWRTGANRATKITFSRDVTFAGKPVPAGTYALFTIPGKTDWTLVLNKRADQAGTGADYKAEDDLWRVQIRPKAAPFRERLAFLFTDFTDQKGSLDLEWEKLRLSIPIAVDTDKQAVDSINKTLDEVWRQYANAARYMLEAKKDYDAGLKFVDQSLALKEDWFNVFIKGQLLAAKGNRKDALPLAEKALELGQKSPNFFMEADVKKALGDWKTKP